jgi:hypothetical protein
VLPWSVLLGALSALVLLAALFLRLQNRDRKGAAPSQAHRG